MIRQGEGFKRKAGAGVLVAAALLFSGCSRSETAAAAESKQPGAAEAATPATPAVPVAEVQAMPMSHSVVLTAEFKPFQEVEVMAKVAGYVKSINVDVGDKVKQGEVLAELEIPEMADDLTRSRAAVERARADVARAKDELQRAESAHEMAHISAKRLTDVSKQQAGMVAQQEVDTVHSKDLEAEAQVNAAKSALSAVQEQVHVNEAEVQHVQTMLAYTRVVAPFDGIVTKRTADLGAMVQAGTASSAMPIVRISQNSKLRLEVPVPESAVPTVHVGQHLMVRVPTLNRSFPGRVARFAERLNTATRTMITEVDVPNPSLVLIPGMFAEVDLTLDSRQGVLTVPISAVDLSQDEGTGEVTVVRPDNRIEVRTVELGMQDANYYEIRSGLAKGDKVVTSNRSSLKSGQQVRPKLVAAAGESQ